MQWWADIVDWLNSDDGGRVITTAVLPFVAILAAGLIAALIARGWAKRMIEHHDREYKASAVAALIGAGRRAAVWSSLTAQEKDHYDTQASEAEVAIRLLPVSGSTLAADWAAHQLAEMKKNSASFSFQAEQTLQEFRDRLIEWQHRPSRAKKLFKQDIERWKFEQTESRDPLVEKQRQWAAAQVDSSDREPASAPIATEPAVVAAPAAQGSVPLSSPSVVSTPTVVATPAPSSPGASTPTVSFPTRAVNATPTTAPVAPSDEAPPPVTASTVRQRIAPQADDDDR